MPDTTPETPDPTAVTLPTLEDAFLAGYAQCREDFTHMAFEPSHPYRRERFRRWLREGSGLSTAPGMIETLRARRRGRP